MPGLQYFAGTHLNPNSTWWSRSGPFFAYINRCQWMLQQGLFVADAAYYYGDHVPNFTQLKRSDPAQVLPGYDYDVVTEEVVLTRMTVRDGRLVLPDGMSYRVLVLPDRPTISLPVLRKLRELVLAGATIIGPKPTQASTLRDYPQCDAEVAQLAGELWTGGEGFQPLRREAIPSASLRAGLASSSEGGTPSPRVARAGRPRHDDPGQGTGDPGQDRPRGAPGRRRVARFRVHAHSRRQGTGRTRPARKNRPSRSC